MKPNFFSNSQINFEPSEKSHFFMNRRIIVFRFKTTSLLKNHPLIPHFPTLFACFELHTPTITQAVPTYFNNQQASRAKNSHFEIIPSILCFFRARLPLWKNHQTRPFDLPLSKITLLLTKHANALPASERCSR